MTTFNISRKFKNNITILLGLFCILSNPAFAVTQNRNIQVTGHVPSFLDLTVQNLDFDVTMAEQQAQGVIAAKEPRNGTGAINVKCNVGYDLTIYADGINRGAANNLKLTHNDLPAENFDINLHLLTEANAPIIDITGVGFHGGAPGRLVHHLDTPAAPADRVQLTQVGTNYNIRLDYDTAGQMFIPGDYVGTMVVVATTLR